MHQSAKFYAEKFFEVYSPKEKQNSYTIVEIGSQDVNGSLREVAPPFADYIGLDFIDGKGVDVIIEDPYSIPLPDNCADVIVTSSCFEHSEFFWLSFLEISRVVKPGGFIYINVPSNGMYHRYPVDCWRFFPDGGSALSAWAKRNGIAIELLESFVGVRSEENIWNDFIAVFQKGTCDGEYSSSLIIDNIDYYTNAKTFRDKNSIINYSQYGQGLHIIQGLQNALHEYQEKILNLESDLRVIKAEIEGIINSKSWRMTSPLRSFIGIFK